MFLSEIGVGFSMSEFGNGFVAEVESNCAKQRTGRPQLIQEFARALLKSPDHRGIAAVLERIEHSIEADERFKGKKIDRPREFREAIRLAEFDDVSFGHSKITRRRTFLRPRPAPKTLSTVHKAKGLECERVAILPCDGRHFADKPHHRCILYVALSRAVSELMLVVPCNDPSPLLLNRAS